MQTIISERKNPVEGFISMFEQVEESVNMKIGQSIEIIRSKERKEK